jgi:hypothetical protein
VQWKQSLRSAASAVRSFGLREQGGADDDADDDEF